MAVGAVATDGAARVAVLGAGHSIAYALGCGVLVVGLARRAGGSVWPVRLAPMVAVAGVVGLLAWRIADALSRADSGRLELVGIVAGVGAAGLGATLGVHQVLGLTGGLTRRLAGPGVDGVVPSGDEVLP
jgi:hypothetical protein